MNIWLICPSIRPDAGEVFAQWQARGYKVAALIRPDVPEPEHCDRIIRAEKYEGYCASINRLWLEITTVPLNHGVTIKITDTDKPDIIITGDDDLYPCEDRTAEELATDFFERFTDGFGVMHLAKLDLGDGESAGHSWVGAEYARRVNGGTGPYWPHYRHYFGDRELGTVAEAQGAFWRRMEFGQRHDHWTLHGERPPHLRGAAEGWAADHQLFNQRKAAGFPGSEPTR